MLRWLCFFLDYETKSTYTFDVIAIDYANNKSDPKTVTFNITDVDDTKPSITGPSGSEGAATSSKYIDENTTTVHTFTADEAALQCFNLSTSTVWAALCAAKERFIVARQVVSAAMCVTTAILFSSGGGSKTPLVVQLLLFNHYYLYKP